MTTQTPADAFPFVKGQEMVFPCQAVSDDSTTISYRWYHNDILVHYDNTTFFDVSDMSLHIVTAKESDGGTSLQGLYRCVANNGFSQAEIDYQWGLSTAGEGDYRFCRFFSVALIGNLCRFSLLL